MKNILRSALALLIITTFTSTFAQDRTGNGNRMDMGILAGYRLNDASTPTDNTSVDGRGSIQVGGLAFLPMTEMISLRTGFIYAARNYQLKDEVTKQVQNAKFGHFDIPVTVMYNFTDLGGIFAGANVSFKVTDDCGTGCDGKSMMASLQFGGHFKVAPQFAAEFYFETAPGKIASGDVTIEDTTAVVLNGVFTFD